MIDNLKLFVKDKHSFENHILNNGLVELNSKLNYHTGEVMEYPKRGRDLNLEIGITNNSGTVLGSIHKYNNIISNNGNHNYNDFSFCQIQEIILGLIDKYNISNATSITNLEFGFNLEIDNNPRTIIDKSVLMYNCKPPNKNLKFSGNGDYKEFQLTDYRVKIYNKSKQFKLSKNILRVELKITRKRLLQQLDIYSLEDLLNYNNYLRLFEFFGEKFEGLMIIDEFDADLIPENDYNKLLRYTNPNYWITIKDKKSPKVIYRLKSDFNKLLNKHNLLKIKGKLREELNSKFIELLNFDCQYFGYRKVS